MATIFETISQLGSIVTDAITAGNSNNIPERIIRNTLIKVATGSYKEVLPIIVPAECCILGDELRSTNVQPRKASNANLTPVEDFNYSVHGLTRFGQIVGDIVSGVSVTATTGNNSDQEISWPLVENNGPKLAVEKLARNIKNRVDIGLGTKKIASLTKSYNMSNPLYGEGRDLLLLNKAFIQEEVTAFISSNYPNLDYSKTKCKQDVGFIIDSVAYDLTYGGNWQSVKAGEAYYEGTNLNIATAEKPATIASYNFLKGIMQTVATAGSVSAAESNPYTQVNNVGIAGDGSVSTSIGQLLDNIVSIVTNGTGTVSVTYPSTSSVATNLISANEVIQNLVPTLQESTIDFINGHFGSFTYNSAKCRRDLDRIITDTAYDIAFGGNYNAVFQGRAYLRPVNAYNLSTQRVETVGAIRNARNLLEITVTSDGSSEVGSSTAGNRVHDAYNIIVSIINGNAEPTLSYPDSAPGIVQDKKDAKALLLANKSFIQADVIAYAVDNYGANFTNNPDKCSRDVGFIVDALIYDILYSTAGNSVTQAAHRIAQSYFVDGELVKLQDLGLTGSGLSAFLSDIYGHLKTVAGTVITETAVSYSGNATSPTTLGAPASATEVADLENSMDVIIGVLNDQNLNNLASPIYPNLSTLGLTSEFIGAVSNIESDKNDVIKETIQYINDTYSDFNYNQAKCSRDIAFILAAAGYDLMLDSNFASLQVGLSYLRAPSKKVIGTQKDATLAANEYVRTQLVDALYGNATAINKINELWEIIQDIIFSGATEGSINQTQDIESYNANRLLELNRQFIVDEVLAYVDDTFKDTVSAVDTGVTAAFTISDTSWLFVGMPVKFTDNNTNLVENAGLDETVTYYIREIYSSTTFSLSSTKYGALRTNSGSTVGGFTIVKAYEYNRELCSRDVNRYIDAIKWDMTYPQQPLRIYNNFGFNVSLYLPGFYKSHYAARYYVNSVLGSQEEDMYYLRNGTGLRLQTLEGLQGDLQPANDYGTKRPTAGAYASLDPGWGPDDNRVWITARSPYVQNCTTFGYAAVGQKIDGALHNGGNDSIVSNDFTQVISDGIGAWLLNNGRAELVSVFTYYAHIGYLSESGGRMRATNGNNSYGDFGSVAEGVDQFETPVTALVDNERQYRATISDVYTDTAALLQVEYNNAGNDYTEAAMNFFGVGTSEETVLEDFRDQAVQQVRIVEVADSTGNPDAVAGGDGYLVVTNTAQTGGTTSSIILAATDGNDSSAYPGMRVYVVGGTGAGQFGIITSYNAGTKIANVKRVSDGGTSPGFDSAIPGATIVAPNGTSTYIVEPNITFESPTRTDSKVTLSATDTWADIHYFASAGQYTEIVPTTTSDGLGAKFDVVRNGEKYYVSLSLDGVTPIAGSGYSRLDTVTLKGSDLDGADVTNDITITITSINSVTGAIVDFDFSGIGRKGVFVALPDTGTTATSSIDGSTWTSNTLNDSYTWHALTSGDIRDGSTTYKPASVIAVGEQAGVTALNISNTGLSGDWRQPTVNPGLTISNGKTDIAFGQISEQVSRYVLIADGDRDVAVSDDGGENWTIYANALPNGVDWSSVTYGQGVFVALREGTNEAATSPNGQTWTTRTLPATSNWSDVAFGKNIFYAIASDTATGAYSSDNGQTWVTNDIAVTTPLSDLPRRIIYGQGIFVVTTANTGEIAFSENGYVWNRKVAINQTTQAITLSFDPYAITSDTYTGGLNALTFGNPGRDPMFIGLQNGNTNVGVKFDIGCTAEGRASVANEKVFEVKITDPGSGYGTTAPYLTITDPNNVNDALYTVRLNQGVLGQPTFVNRGTGYISATAEIDNQKSNGFANYLQDGSFIAVRRLSETPVNGSNIVFDSLPNQVFKLVNTVSIVGTNDGSKTAFLQISPPMEIEDAVENNDPVTLRIRFSQVRLTGHDFLDIGTGNFDETNYPNEVFGAPENEPNQANETVNSNGGRVFFTATDQDGNFRVGDLFSIEQATGVATLNAEAFNIAGLQELTLGEVTLGGNSASVNEFSTDPFFTADSDSVVPTQRAIKAYIEAQIGGGGASLVVNTVTAGNVFINTNLITTITGGPLYLKANVNFTKTVLGVPLAFNYFLR